MEMTRLERLKLRIKRLVDLDSFTLKDYASMSRVDEARTKEDYRTRPFNPVASLPELEAFQNLHDIILPPEYTAFLTTIGNGGLGPHSGLWKFSDAVAHLKEAGIAPFPYTIKDGESYRAARQLAWPDPVSIPFTNTDTRGILFLNGFESLLKFKVGRYALVIKGEAAGTVWLLQEGSYYEPVYRFEKRMDFLDIYELWLDQTIVAFDTER
jgi:hypothetical protein